ncbi:MAG: T9SS type A sorting domain-containing protein, partial [Bacteroidia bacterium]|nr:T9SS type A sorting domain-containing protein [Bacteroidia bacterium]
KRIRLLFAILWGTIIQAHSQQQPRLIVDSIQINQIPQPPFLLFVNNSYQMQASIRNIGTVDFVDSLSLVVHTAQYPNAKLIVPFGFDTIFAGSFKYYNINFFVDTTVFSVPQFRLGGDIFVVWPIGSGARVDTTYFPIFVDVINSIANQEKNTPTVRLFPVPVQSEIRIRTPENISVERVRIFDVNGKLMIETNQSRIPIEQWSTGIYWVTCELTTGATVIKPVLIE